MTTRINFNIDSTVKSEAMKKAKERGISLSMVLSEATRAFANDQLDIGLVDEQLADDIARSREDIAKGRGAGVQFARLASCLAPPARRHGPSVDVCKWRFAAANRPPESPPATSAVKGNAPFVRKTR